MILNRKMKSLISDIWPGWDRTWLIPAGTNAFPLTVFNGVALPGVYTIALAGPSNVVARYGGVTVRGGESNAVAFPPGSTLETVLVQAEGPGEAVLTLSFQGTGAASVFECETQVEIKAVIVMFKAMPGSEHKGFEPDDTLRSEEPYAWASVDKTSTSSVVRIEIEPSSVADMIELTVVSGSGCADITPKIFSAGNTDLTITGQGNDGNATVEARIKNTTSVCECLNVMVLPKRGPIGVGIYRVWDSRSPVTALPTNILSDVEIVAAMNERFAQAQITFEVDGSSGTYDVPYDNLQPPYTTTNGWTAGSDGMVQAEELSSITANASSWTAALKLIILRANGDPVNMHRGSPYSPLLIEGFQSSTPFTHVVMFTEPYVRPLVQVIPHEFGHTLGLAYYNDDGGYHDLGAWPEGSEKLMRPGVPSGSVENPTFPEFGRWLRHEDWRQSNDEARFYIDTP